MSDREDSPSGSRSRSESSHKSASPKRSNSGKRSRSPSKSPKRKSRSLSNHRYSRSRSRERKYSRSRSHSRHKYASRSRSRSYDHRRSNKYDRSPRQRSGSRSPYSQRRKHMGDRDRLQDNPRKSRCLGVFGLNLRTHEEDLRQLFERYGPVEALQLVYDHQTRRSRGFAFVYMKYLEDAMEAKERAAGLELDGRNIRVDYSITDRPHSPTPGRYLGRTYGGAYRHQSPSPYKRSGARYSRSRSRSRSTSRRRY